MNDTKLLCKSGLENDGSCLVTPLFKCYTRWNTQVQSSSNRMRVFQKRQCYYGMQVSIFRPALLQSYKVTKQVIPWLILQWNFVFYWKPISHAGLNGKGWFPLPWSKVAYESACTYSLGIHVCKGLAVNVMHR